MRKITIGDIILWILFIISLFLILWYLLGNSPTFEQIILSFMLTAIYGIAIKLASIDTELKSLEKSFRALATDFKNHLNKNKN